MLEMQSASSMSSTLEAGAQKAGRFVSKWWSGSSKDPKSEGTS